MAVLTALLCGCGSPQPSLGVSDLVSLSRAKAPQHDREGGWMLAEAKSETLLYVSASPNDVFVYAYPRPKLVGELHFDADVEGLCSDKDGNVWVPLFNHTTFSSKILEYRHGAKRRIAALADAGLPSGCAVDPVTGNLAVSNLCVDYRGTSCLNYGDVVIYDDAQGSGAAYQDPTMNEYGFCAYDDSGSLFVDGTGFSEAFILAELPRGAPALQDIALGQTLSTPAGIGWHGRHLAISSASTIYEFSVRRRQAIEVRTTPLNDTTQATQFALRGNTVIVPGAGTNNVAFYRYPQGGSPAVNILLFGAISAAISPPPPP